MGSRLDGIKGRLGTWIIPSGIMLIGTLYAFPAAVLGATPILREVARMTRQWTGVAVSAKGRIFVNFPRWSDAADLSVAEVKLSGEIVPYPNPEWNLYGPDLSPADHFVCVQSVHIDAQNTLWILDAANPGMKGVVEGGAKLVKVNLEQNRVERTLLFNADVAPREATSTMCAWTRSGRWPTSRIRVWARWWRWTSGPGLPGGSSTRIRPRRRRTSR